MSQFLLYILGTIGTGKHTAVSTTDTRTRQYAALSST
jgi:hypothetical protein